MQRIKGRKSGNYEMDMIHGSMFPKIVAFTIPLVLTSLLQLLYNAADVIVVGRYSGREALAAVGSTGALINLLINMFLGLSVGTNVITARYFGADDRKGVSESVHTSITISVIGGIILGIFGFLFGGTFLKWMGSPEDVLPLATLYVKIYFIGMPFNMLYNFGASILRAVGDTRRPLYFLMISGVVNVVLNLFFVIVLRMGIAGVAWATISSQALSSILVLLCLIRTEGTIRFDPRSMGVSWKCLKEMMKIGVPAGFQGVCFSLSNVIIQSTVNSYGSIVVAGNSASQNLEGFMYVSMNAVHQAAVTFVSANFGAGDHARMRKAALGSLALVFIIGALMGAVYYALTGTLLGIYTTSPEVVAAGIPRLRVFACTYFLCGMMDVLCGVMRGLGSSVTPMIVSIIGACGFRIFWIAVVLPMFPDAAVRLWMLYMSYPISWILTGGTHFICCIQGFKKLPAV